MIRLLIGAMMPQAPAGRQLLLDDGSFKHTRRAFDELHRNDVLNSSGKIIRRISGLVRLRRQNWPFAMPAAAEHPLSVYGIGDHSAQTWYPEDITTTGQSAVDEN